MAALLVFGLHLRNLGYLNGAPVDVIGWPFMAGATGVSFFFVLSGFVLTWSARPHDTAIGFWRRRIARIYPVHLATAAAAMLLGSTRLGQSRPTGAQLVANLLLIHSWWPAWWQTLNPVSWSLACEAFFYATFPALAWVLRRLGHRALTALAAAATTTVVVLPLANTHDALGLALFSSPLARLPEFVLGAALARLVQLGRWRGPGLKASSAIAVTGYVLASLASADFAYAACTILGFALVIPAAALADLRDMRSVLRHPALIRLGELSFAFYMVHILVLHAGSAVLTTLPAPTGAAIALTTSLTLSWLIHEGVERPARKLILAPARRQRRRDRAITTRIRRDSTMKTRKDNGTPDPAAGSRQPRHGRRRPAAGALAAALLGLWLGAGCSSAPAAGNGAGQSMSQGDQELVSFTQCMRDHGVQMSDPYHRPGHTGLTIDFPPQDAATRTAYAACNHYVAPFVQAKQAGAAAQAAPHLAALTRYAGCMRAHDIPLLDPNQQGQVDMGNLPGMLDSISRYSPQFRSADSACRNLLPAGVADDGSGP